ncbi:antibiotic biosynthesis monooxygenase family protein [Flagellimonas sp. S174]|uniref:antibiotic biosynthesis monooxygenase family protein n=1 Tax=Flagellimonas sp. S174 TaxID=3410790 RepID=UPI003BF4B70D
MIRIIYTWSVEPEKLNLFIETWKKTTNTIHEQVKGARGSFMIQNDNDTKEIKTVARWDSLEDWKNFWKSNNKTKMESMHELGHRVSVDIFKEIDDFTR